MSAPIPESEDAPKHQMRSDQHRHVPHFCSTCFKDLSNESFCRCTRCKSFIQCFECCAYGYSKDDHIRTHPFIICEGDMQPVFVEDWTVEEEIRLLWAFDVCGFGNWSDISHHLKTKSPLECKVHYYEIYFGSAEAPRAQAEVREPTPLPPPPPFDTTPVESCPSCSHEKNMMLANNADASTPAVASGYMPMRGEFEEEFNDDAEHIIGGITLDEDEAPAKLEEKLKLLLCYNSQVVARREKTRVIEEWGLQYAKGKEWQSTLAAITGEHEVYKKLLTFAPYIGRKRTEMLAQRLHELSRNIDMIKARQHWQANGVRTAHEGVLFNALEEILKDGRVPENESACQKWNKRIEEYLSQHGKTETEEAKLLSEQEFELCKVEDIEPPVFTAMKDLLIREFTIRGALSRQEAIELLPEQGRQMNAMYELFLNNGWITE